MKTHYIVFSGPLAVGVHAGTITQSRRVATSARCPYGGAGDRLVVRETWRPDCRGNPGESDVRGIHYKADDSYEPRPQADMLTIEGRIDSPWRSPRFMPAFASRTLLQLVDVVREKLHAIDGNGARACGVGSVEEYSDLWDRLNRDRGWPWSSDPWVWGLDFRKVAP